MDESSKEWAEATVGALLGQGIACSVVERDGEFGVRLSDQGREALKLRLNLNKSLGREQARLRYWDVVARLPSNLPLHIAKHVVETNLPGLARQAGITRPPAAGRNSDHYVNLLLGQAAELMRQDPQLLGWKARAMIANQTPSLHKAAWGADPQIRIAGALEYETEVEKLGLDVAYERVRKHLAADAMEVMG